MRTSEPQAYPSPPNLVTALLSGFDAISNHAGLILFPIALDLLIWLGPHLSLKSLLKSLFNQVLSLPGFATTQTADLVKSYREIGHLIAGRINLIVGLRSYPVGVPSLMAGRLPIASPNGSPFYLETNSFIVSTGIWLLVTSVGLVIGSLYYSMVAQAVLIGKVQWRRAFTEWPWNSIQVLGLALLLVVGLFLVSLPLSCLISSLSSGGIPLGQCTLILYGGLLMWLIFPLLLSAHGIFVNRNNTLVSIRTGIRLTRLTLPTTGMLFIIILVFSQLLDMLWNIPNETSWLMLIGIAGHAFVGTGLLAATFVYYRDAGQWVQAVLEKVGKASQA